MTDTCPRDWMGFCLVAMAGACFLDMTECRHEGKTLRDKLRIIERRRQKLLKAAGRALGSPKCTKCGGTGNILAPLPKMPQAGKQVQDCPDCRGSGQRV